MIEGNIPIAAGFIAAGGALLYFGGDWLVKGASSVSARLGISPLVIGLTVVAFGTSAPELCVSLVAALKGTSGIALGNVIGSNIANLGLILGISALIMPLTVKASTLKIEIPFLIIACVACWLLCLDGKIGRIDGFVLLALFVVFIVYCIRMRKTSPQEGEPAKADLLSRWWFDLVFLLLGVVALPAGSDLFVRGATTIATKAGISDFVIGLSLVAVGTSLPELATTSVAALRGKSDIAVGNIVGSNIFNTLLILGTVTPIRPIAPAPGEQWFSQALSFDMPLMTAMAFLILPLTISKRKLQRWEGGLLLLIYGAYITMLVLRGS